MKATANTNNRFGKSVDTSACSYNSLVEL